MASVIGRAVVENFPMMAFAPFPLLSEQATLLANFRKDCLSLNEELKDAMGFLQDADQQSRQREEVKQWLENFRVIILSAEDIFEDYAEESIYGNESQSCGLSCTRLIFRHKVALMIKDIRDHIRSIIREANQLKLAHQVVSADEAFPSTSRSVDRKRSSLLPSDSHPVGIQPKVDDMLSLLENPAFPVIAVVGMEGIGKTYLLQHVFNQTTERYEKSIWLSVSQSYSISDLQKKLAFQLDKDLSEQIENRRISEHQVAQLIHEKLRGKMCLVVLDDVRSATREDDLLSKLGLPKGGNSPCKIVVSTRSTDMCTNLDAEVYEMGPLSDEESWSLFSFYAFRECEGNRVPHQQLEEVGCEIVKQCRYLPLAIKTIAASLANTTMPSDWELKLRQLERVVTANVDRYPVMSVLRLIYDSLPARLKACFAYLSLFPGDEEIECEYLINMWIGEGFVPAGEGQWDVAWDCLYQLANLCLLQVWEKVKNRDLTKYCKIHGLLYDLAIHISRENKCAFSVDGASRHINGGTGCRRILLANKNIDDNAISEFRPVSLRTPPVSLRILINAIFDNRPSPLRTLRVSLRTISLSKNENITSIPGNLFTARRGLEVRRLHVLDLSSTSISTLPASIGKLKFLKVLNLRRTEIREVPECVRHLKSLLFLAMSESCKELPVWISELKCLQHLECKGANRMPKGLSKLASLRTLGSNRLELSVEEDEFMSLEDLANMTQLQELWLRVDHYRELARIEEGILARLVKMRRLGLINWMVGESETDLPHVPANMTAMKHLERLSLYTFAVPSWICGLANLRDLQLYRCECNDYPELQRMPNLMRLGIWGNFGCRELPKAFGKSGSFPSLRFLEIWEFYELEEFPELEEAAMACLEEFNLCKCPRVKTVGEGLERLKRLKVFNYFESGTNEVRETLKEGGKYWKQIKDINPGISIKELWSE